MVHPESYPNLLAESVVEEERATSLESLEARGESNDEEELIDVVGGAEVGVGSDAESEGFTFPDALRRANLIAASDPETVLITSAMPTCKYICTITFSCFYVNTHWPLCVPCNQFDARI